MNNVKSDNRPVVSGEISNSASVGSNDLPSESGNSARTFEDWLNDPAVVWSEDPLKGGFDTDGFGESVPLGTAVMLYYTSASTDQQTIDIYIIDNFGQVQQLSFSFNNDNNEE